MIDAVWKGFRRRLVRRRHGRSEALLRLDADDAEFGLNGSSLVAGIRILLDRDPKLDHPDNVAMVMLG